MACDEELAQKHPTLKYGSKKLGKKHPSVDLAFEFKIVPKLEYWFLKSGRCVFCSARVHQDLERK